MDFIYFGSFFFKQDKNFLTLTDHFEEHFFLMEPKNSPTLSDHFDEHFWKEQSLMYRSEVLGNVTA